jgi:hypothetical protein
MHPQDTSTVGEEEVVTAAALERRAATRRPADPDAPRPVAGTLRADRVRG